MTKKGTGSESLGPIQTARLLLGDERLRFLLVGAFNTVFGYGLFVLIEISFGRNTSYLVSLYVSYVIATMVAFVTHRRFTFQISGRGKIVLDFLRFQGVNLVSLAVNSLALPLLVEVGRLLPIVAQAIIVVFTTLISYLGHKFFSFRRATKHQVDTHPSQRRGNHRQRRQPTQI